MKLSKLTDSAFNLAPYHVDLGAAVFFVYQFSVF